MGGADRAKSISDRLTELSKPLEKAHGPKVQLTPYTSLLMLTALCAFLRLLCHFGGHSLGVTESGNPNHACPPSGMLPFNPCREESSSRKNDNKRTQWVWSSRFGFYFLFLRLFRVLDGGISRLLILEIGKPPSYCRYSG